MILENLIEDRRNQGNLPWNKGNTRENMGGIIEELYGNCQGNWWNTYRNKSFLKLFFICIVKYIENRFSLKNHKV